MTNPPLPTFRWTDPWLLLAVGYASREQPASVARVLEVGDGINHAIFTHAELDRGLARVIGAGLVEQAATGFRLSARGAELLAQAGERGQSVQAQLDAVCHLLGAPAWSADAEVELEGSPTEWSMVEPAQYHAATKRYS